MVVVPKHLWHFGYIIRKIQKCPGLKNNSLFALKNTILLPNAWWVLEKGYPKCIVLADSWYCCEPFIEHLKRLKLNYVFEMPGDLNIRITCSETKLTPTGRVAKNQYDLKKVDGYFASIQEIICCGFAADKDTGKKAKVLYHTKITTGRLNAIPGKFSLSQGKI